MNRTHLPTEIVFQSLSYLLILGVAAAVLAAPALVRADLNAEVQNVLNDKLLAKARVSIEIVALGDSADSSRVMLAHHGDLPLVPASNLKLITTSAALDKLGVDFKFRTLLLKHDDDLILIGDGDPTLGDAELLRKSGWDVTTVFKQWAEGLKRQQVTQINNVIVDDSVFEDVFVHPNWPANQLEQRYAAGVAGLNLNANCVDFKISPAGPGIPVSYATDPPTRYIAVRNFCVGGNDRPMRLSRKPATNEIVLAGESPLNNILNESITIFDPPLFTGTVLSETLTAGGVTVNGQVSRDRTLRQTLARLKPEESAGYKLLAVHETPIAHVLARANKDSMNLYAECLCKRLGYAASGKPGSWDNGPAAVGAFLKQVGVPEGEFHLDDGCGLSKENTISSNAIASVLIHNYFCKNHQAFFSSLSVAGMDGTLEKRFESADMRDLRLRVFGKSGFVEGVSSLSGYLHGRDDRWYAFSILMNGIPPKSNSAIKPLQEMIVKALDVSLPSRVTDAR